MKAAVPKPGTASEIEIPLRITLVQPPAGVQFCLQRGVRDLVGQRISTGADLSFDLTIRAIPGPATEPPGLRGSFAQGPPGERFIYICSGARAGQLDSCWERRAKIPLTGIVSAQVQAAARSGAGLEARIDGRARDGGPCCATVKLLGAGWQLAE